MDLNVQAYNNNQLPTDSAICDLLANIIDAELNDTENKIWHAHPVWFLDGNPIVGYSKQKKGIRLMFWSGADFEEENSAFRNRYSSDFCLPLGQTLVYRYI